MTNAKQKKKHTDCEISAKPNGYTPFTEVASLQAFNAKIYKPPKQHDLRHIICGLTKQQLRKIRIKQDIRYML